MFIRLKWTSIDNEDLDQPVAERRTRHLNRQLPRCYQDIAPEPLLPLLPLPSQPEHPEADSAISTRRILKSLRNTFGLYRQYYAIRFLDRDPIENITPNDLTDLLVKVSVVPAPHIKIDSARHDDALLLDLGLTYSIFLTT